MPKSKDLKRLVRARMQKSGESYTAARRQILAKRTKKSPSSNGAASTDYAAITKMSDAALQAKTGRDWKGWLAVLDADGAREMLHRDIAKLLAEKHGVPPWWSQMVTVGYERIRGLREHGQRRAGMGAGTYEVGKTRTYPVSVDALYRACRDARVRAKWLPLEGIVVRTSIPSRSMRIRLAGDVPVELMFLKKGPSKSALNVTHHKLASKAEREETKKFWSERLDALGKLLRAD